MGGDESEELIAPLQGTTAVAVKCAGCGYAASLQAAEFQRASPQECELLPLEEVAVPQGAEPNETLAFPESLSNHELNCVPFVADSNVVLVVAPARLPLNIEKLMVALSRAGLERASIHRGTSEELLLLGGDWDWISLVRTPPAVLVVADESVRSGKNFVFPSSRPGHYLRNLNSGRDFRVDMFADLADPSDGDQCLRCGGRLQSIRGTEVAHLFKLGSGFAEAFGAFLEPSKPLQMGCYGLGVTRLMAAIVHQGRDERGIVWPHAVAPYTPIILPAANDGSCRAFSERLYCILSDSAIDVLLDDTDDTPEKRMAYADLLGIPVQIIAHGPSQQTVEMRERGSAESAWVHVDNLVARLQRCPASTK
jgi:prolyl-tRNA synthetase